VNASVFAIGLAEKNTSRRKLVNKSRSVRREQEFRIELACANSVVAHATFTEGSGGHCMMSALRMRI
jgi:hypothetical protein